MRVRRTREAEKQCQRGRCETETWSRDVFHRRCFCLEGRCDSMALVSLPRAGRWHSVLHPVKFLVTAARGAYITHVLRTLARLFARTEMFSRACSERRPWKRDVLLLERSVQHYFNKMMKDRRDHFFWNILYNFYLECCLDSRLW